MKKILIFSTAYFPFVGGAEVAVKEIADRLGDFDFDMVTAKIDRQLSRFEKVGRVNIYRIGWGLGALDKFLLPFFGYFIAAKLHKQNKYNAIWSIMASQASIAASFFKIAKPQIPLLLTLQEGDEEEHLKRYVFGSSILYKLLIRPWHLLVFKKADYITAISNYLKERALKNKVKCLVEIVPNGVDINHFSQEYIESELAEFKNKLGKKQDEKYIITTSRLVLKNAVDDAIRTLQYLPNNVKFLILGTGHELERLQDLTKELRLEERVIFLGHIDHKEIPKYLKISDVFVRPSLSEGLGNAFLEAMSSGVPVIGTPVGGIPDFLKDGETGLFCEVKNPKSIAEKVGLLLFNGALRQKLITNGRKLIEENYNWDLIAKKMRDIFDRLSIKN